MHWLTRLISTKRRAPSPSDPIYFRPVVSINGWEQLTKPAGGSFSDYIDFATEDLAPSAIRIRDVRLQ